VKVEFTEQLLLPVSRQEAWQRLVGDEAQNYLADPEAPIIPYESFQVRDPSGESASTLRISLESKSASSTLLTACLTMDVSIWFWLGYKLVGREVAHPTGMVDGLIGERFPSLAVEDDEA
jgi:hypothetical protein